MKTIGLIFGGRSVEHKVSVASARTISRGLEEAGHGVVPLGIGPDGGWVSPEDAKAALDGLVDRLPPGGRPVISTLAHLLETDVDLFFPIVHGTWGEDGTLQGLCEMLDVPYVGANVTTSAIAMDKVSCKQVLAAKGVPVVDWEHVTTDDLKQRLSKTLSRLERLPMPLFVKPSVGGSSVGVTMVERAEKIQDALQDASTFGERLVVERGISGRELECAVLGYRNLEASAVGEIVSGKAFYDYRDKYIDDGARLIAPADLPSAIEREIQQLALKAFDAIGGFGMARVDFFLEGSDRIFVNEINTLPGFTEISMYPRLWGLSGVTLPELVDRLVTIALERHVDRARLDQGIKSWIDAISSD